MKPLRLAALLVASITLGCGGGGGGGGGGGTKVKGALKVLNGPTTTGVGARPASAPGLVGVVGLAPAETTYRLSPATMTMTVTGVGLIPAGGSANDTKLASLTGCTATYDRSKGSLAELSNCEVTAPTGSFDGVVVQYDPTFTVVVDDAEASIYSDPGVLPGGLTNSPPAGGAKAIQVRDQNQTSDLGQVATYFPAPITISEGSTPQLYVVFEPTHWMLTTLGGGGTFSAPSMGGNPPIVPAMSKFGKAALYSNIETTMSYPATGRDKTNGMSLLFLYGDETTPVSVTWQDHTICPTTGSAPVVAFNGDGTRWGTFGRLGLDPGANLAWVSAAGFDQTTGEVTGYSGVYKMPAGSAVGDETTLQYQCTTAVPPTTSGGTYSSGAPVFTPDGTVSLTLVEN
jgi:hypothetical protein